MRTVVYLERAQKDLKVIPRYILLKLNKWVADVEKIGLRETRKKRGYHDEPLQGKRWGQRSIRLSKSYRAVYVEQIAAEVHIVSIEEVTKHEY